MYKKVSKLKLRFNTSRGMLSAEQLWDLSLIDLKSAIKAVKKLLQAKNDDEDLAFLDSETTVDVENQLRFDILKDIYVTLKKEQDDRKNLAADKRHNDKIDSLIAAKQDQQLEDLSIEALIALRK